jgi:3-dehydrotetronate 4-kinase
MAARLLLGCIADDFTGATDLANNLVRSGMRTVQTIGIPTHALDTDVDAVVVALKTRTIPAADAVAQSLDALRWLREQGARQIYFKYCSTFDSTPAGNIGPVAEALMDALDEEDGTGFAIATPAFPDAGRTVFSGHLFVGDVLLNESGMQNHPLNPMTDPNLVRVLQRQCRRKVGLVDYRIVALGPEAIRARFAVLRDEGVGIAIVDAISNDDLLRLGPALKGMRLVTGGSGLAIAIPANFDLSSSDAASALPAPTGAQAVVSGSCSSATNRQVRNFIESGGSACAVDPLAFDSAAIMVEQAVAWCASRLEHGPVLVYSTADPAAVKKIQERLTPAVASALIEGVLASIARRLVECGVRQLVVAGGETSGACVQALGVTQMQIGPQVDPGVPWCHARADVAGPRGLHLALKSGNFGSDDFFTKVWKVLA